MSFLLMIFLTLVCLFEDYPAPPWAGEPALAAGLTALSVLLVAAHAWWLSRRVSAPLARDPSLRDSLLPAYERGRFWHQIIQFACYGIALAVLGWGWAVQSSWRGEGGSWAGLEVLLLLPFLVMQTLTWLLFYDADRAAHRAAHRLMDAEPFGQSWLEARPAVAAPPFAGRWSYVAFNFRQKLALVFIPVLLLIVQKELSRLLPSGGPYVQPILGVLSIVAMLAVFVCMPLFVRAILGLKPLPEGPIRDRLLAASKRLKFRCSGILLWNTRRGMANAMVIGLVPWLRYVVFTDKLLEEFSEEEVEAVFGHEVGHVQHMHMPFYLLFLSGSMAALGLLADHFFLPVLSRGVEALAERVPGVPLELAMLLGPGGKLSLFPVVVLLLGYVFLIFGFLSRRCERQADVYGCRAVSCGDPECAGHHEGTVLADRGRAICPTGVRTFMRALEKVARVNGISRDRPGLLQSWQHSTIARRVAFLYGMLLDRAAEPGFQRRLLVIKGGLVAALGGLLAVLTVRGGW
jgi:STE24 endopeptidase